MTRLLASVADPGEARLALECGADIIDVLDSTHARDVVSVIAGRRPVSAIARDPTMLSLEHLAACGVDLIRVAIGATGEQVPVLAEVSSRVKFIAVFFADQVPDPAVLDTCARAGFAGGMLDCRDGDQRLLDAMNLPGLRRFVLACRQHGLLSGLAGALEPPDVPRLLVLAPGFLAVRGRAGRKINRRVMQAMRALVPPEGFEGEPDSRGEAGPTDRVFVHGLVLPARIGAYARERDATQRVRFDVDAAVIRLARPTQDMRDVFSYDLISDGIRLIVDSGHIPLVETLAERIAAMVLAHPRVTKVSVRVEKLDLGDATVGVVIERTRADPGDVG